MMQYIDIIKALIVAALWGGNFIAAKIVLEYFPPVFAMIIRVIIVIAILIPFIKPSAISLKRIFFMTFNYNVGHMALLYISVWYGLPVTAAIIATQMQVPFTTILSIILLKDRVYLKQIIGMIIAFIGVLIIVGNPTVVDNLSLLFTTIIAALFFAFFNIQIKQCKNFDIIPYILWSSILALPQLGVLSYMLEYEQWPRILPEDNKLWIAMSYIGMTNIVAFWLWFSLLKKYSVNLVMPFALLIPVFGIIGSTLILSEMLSWHFMLGGTMTIIGVAIMVIRFTRISKPSYN